MHDPKHLLSTATAMLPAVAEPPAPQLQPRIRQPTRESQRRLALMQRSGLFAPDKQGVEVERACSFEALRDAYRLVHDVHVEAGFIQPHPSRLRLRLFEAMARTATFVARADGRVVGVLSAVFDTPEFGLPSDIAFKPELDALRRAGVRLCEVTNQAVDVRHRQTGVATELMRCAIAHGDCADYDESIATVSPGHAAFYDLLGFREIGGQRSYSPGNDDPVVALSCHVSQWRPGRIPETGERFLFGYMVTDNPYRARVAAWDAEARSRFMDGGLLRRLFVEERNLLSACSSRELGALRRFWGEALFQEVSACLDRPEGH